nr:hypothetical protein [Proteus sp. TJ1640]
MKTTGVVFCISECQARKTKSDALIFIEISNLL